MTDACKGPHSPIWRIITPGGETSSAEERLCYVHLDTAYDGAKGTHVWTATVWNADGYREIYSEEEWKTAKLVGLASPVRPETDIQRVILHSVEEEVITPRCGLQLYRETLEEAQGSTDEVPATAGEARHD